jgi:hypothetical protein
MTSVGIFSDNSNQILTADATCTWSSSNTGRATISNANGTRGLVTPVAAGAVTITHSCNGGAVTGNTTLTVTSATLQGVTITPTNPTIANGTPQQFTAMGTFSDSTVLDITSQVSWSSGTTGTATISNAAGSQGLVSSVAAGTSVITALHVASTKSASTTLTVTNATLSSIAITPANAVTIGYGTTQQFTAVGTYSDGSTQNITSLVTWASSSTGVASISNVAGSNGLATSITAGITNITATLGGKTSNTANLDVRIITLISISVTPASPTVTVNGTQQFLAVGTYNDGTQQDLTSQVTWNTSNTAVAVVSSVPGSMGLATATGTNGQTAIISADRAGITGSTIMTLASDITSPTVLSATLQSGNTLLVTYSEPVNVTQAQTASIYKITTAVSGICGDNSNFASASAVTVSSVAAVSMTQFLLSIGATASTTYTLIVDKTGVQDLAANFLGCANSANFIGLDTTSPTVSSANSSTGTVVRVTFSENVNTTEARTAANYKIVDASGAGVCTDGSNFTSSTQTSDFAISSVTGSGSLYDITLSATQVSGKSYRLIVNKANIHDVATTPNAMGCPNYADFIGLEQIKLSSAVCVDTTHIIATFSKAIKTGLNAASSGECTSPAECANRYQLSGGSSLGNINDVRVLDGTLCGGAVADTSKVCINHSTAQGGGLYTVTVANNIDGDGFNNTTWGSIQNSAGTENIQPSPNDRRSFSGCASAPQNFVDGPISTNPFTDGSSFGYVSTYFNKIYIGPNSNGNSGTRFDPDGANPESLSFRFAKDTSTANSTGIAANTAATRDGSIAVPPFVTIGHTGCTSNNAGLATGCGPNNEDGRGIFASGVISGTEYLFITGGRSAGNDDYLYYTSDTANQLNFNYLDASATFNSASIAGNSGTESISIMNNKVYWMSPGNRSARPYFVKINNLNSDQISGTDSVFMNMRYMTGFGGSSSTAPNKADKIGGTSFVFNNILYMANSGSNSTDGASCDVGTTYSAGVCEQTGGIIRSTNNDPAACTAADTCANWSNITPSSVKFKQYFTTVLTKLADILPSERPIPAMAAFNSNLYMIRNACTTRLQNRACSNAAPCNDDVVCPAGNEVPQLWKCTPTGGGGTTCGAGDWSLVAENGATGKSNMGVAANTKVSVLVTNGTQMYIGFDSASGVQMWRTKSGVTNPSAATDFEQIGATGLGDAANNLELYSAVSMSQLGVYYLYVSTGKTGQPVRVYRQFNY